MVKDNTLWFWRNVKRSRDVDIWSSSTVIAGPVQRCVALVVCEVSKGWGGALQESFKHSNMATSRSQVQRGAAPDVPHTNTGPSLDEGLHTLFLAGGSLQNIRQVLMKQ